MRRRNVRKIEAEAQNRRHFRLDGNNVGRRADVEIGDINRVRYSFRLKNP